MMVSIVGSNRLNGMPIKYAVELRDGYRVAGIQCESEEEAKLLKQNIQEWLKTNRGQAPHEVAAHWSE